MEVERLSPPRDEPWLGGVDEAGRGPVMGPMVIAGVAIRDVTPLVDMGVRDSKALAPSTRERLYDMILDTAEAVVVEISASEIDSLMSRMTLNVIETDAFALAISALAADTFYVDAIGPVETLSKELVSRTGKEVTARSKADAVYPVVSAASIVAKVRRDRAVRVIADDLGTDIGSGYPSDPITMGFLKGYVAEHRELPPHTRSSWKTSSKLLDHRLDDF